MITHNIKNFKGPKAGSGRFGKWVADVTTQSVPGRVARFFGNKPYQETRRYYSEMGLIWIDVESGEWARHPISEILQNRYNAKPWLLEKEGE